MKIKVSLTDKSILKQYYAVLTFVGVILGLSPIFFTIPKYLANVQSYLFLFVLLSAYVIIWIYANKMKSVSILINNSVLDIKIGDLFDESGLKVIAFNEYFDTKVDNIIISKNSLNGIFITEKVDDVEQLDMKINSCPRLSTRKLEVNKLRIDGNKQKYMLGSIYVHDNEYLLTAFTKFDDENRANLTMREYVDCLLNFWNEIDIVYANRAVFIPLLGAGITRISGGEKMSEQEKLEILIWTFKISRIKFTHPAKVSIIIHDSMQDKINFFKLKEIV